MADIIRPEDIPPGIDPVCARCLMPVEWSADHQHWHHVHEADGSVCQMLFGAFNVSAN